MNFFRGGEEFGAVAQIEKNGSRNRSHRDIRHRDAATAVPHAIPLPDGGLLGFQRLESHESSACPPERGVSFQVEGKAE